MVVYGASGHGKVIIEILEDMGIDDIQVWDDTPGAKLWNYPSGKPLSADEATDTMVIAIGNNAVRKMIAERYEGNVKFATAIHPGTQISKRATIGEGSVLMAGILINADTTIGKHCIINTGCTIDHDCVIGDYAHISPNATLCGSVQVGEGTHIGAASVVIQCKKIGKYCTIGAGTVVIGDVPDYATVVGNPGRIIKIAKSETDES